MALFVVRVWLPDRPGALGAVASRIGSVKADVVGIDILERGGGRAVDELTIDLADARNIGLLISEIGHVDGVDVEHVRPAKSTHVDRAAESVRVAADIAAATTHDECMSSLVNGTCSLFEADWVCIVDPSTGAAGAVCGGDDMPSGEWLAAFVIGTGAGDGAYAAVDELARVSLELLGLEVVVSRAHLPIRVGERAVFEQLAAIADRRANELAIEVGSNPKA